MVVLCLVALRLMHQLVDPPVDQSRSIKGYGQWHQHCRMPCSDNYQDRPPLINRPCRFQPKLMVASCRTTLEMVWTKAQTLQKDKYHIRNALVRCSKDNVVVPIISTLAYNRIYRVYMD